MQCTLFLEKKNKPKIGNFEPKKIKLVFFQPTSEIVCMTDTQTFLGKKNTVPLDSCVYGYKTVSGQIISDLT